VRKDERKGRKTWFQKKERKKKRKGLYQPAGAKLGRIFSRVEKFKRIRRDRSELEIARGKQKTCRKKTYSPPATGKGDQRAGKKGEIEQVGNSRLQASGPWRGNRNDLQKMRETS